MLAIKPEAGQFFGDCLEYDVMSNQDNSGFMVLYSLHFGEKRITSFLYFFPGFPIFRNDFYKLLFFIYSVLNHNIFDRFSIEFAEIAFSQIFFYFNHFKSVGKC